MEDYLGKKTSFWWLDLLFSGWKNEHFFDWFQSKVKNYLLIQKDNSLTFLCDKEGNVFSYLSLFDNWSCIYTRNFIKNFHLPVIKNGRLFRQKNFWWLDLLFRGEKMNIFRLISIESEELSLIQKIILWHFLCDKRRERFFRVSLFDNWSCSTQEIL